MKRQLHLNLFIQSRGHHEASWRHPASSPLALTDVRYYQDLAQRAEAGLFDSIFFADQLAVGEDIAQGPRTGLEPVTLLAALAVSTSRIGLIATASTTYTEPFNLARQFASLDHISGGRIGWNIVTSWLARAAQNYGAGRKSATPIATRGPRSSWRSSTASGTAGPRTRSWTIESAGGFPRPERIRSIDHEGEHYRVAGPLNVPRCPQGRPVLVQAGSSETGRDFAARHGEAIFTAQLEKATAQEFYSDLKSRVAAQGRSPDQVVILPGLSPLIASSEAEARRLADELCALANPEVGRQRLSARFGGHDFSRLELDEPLAVDDFPDPGTVEAARSRTEVIVGLVRRERPTLRGLLATLAGARGHYTLAGTPEQVADFMEEWLLDGAADGFNVMPPILPGMLEVFVAEVIPLLQRRGLFRTAYDGEMLRDHYGLARPDSQFD